MKREKVDIKPKLKSFVTYEDWLKIDQHEIERRQIKTKIREKLLRKSEYGKIINKKLL